jgi:uncharacterized protein
MILTLRVSHLIDQHNFRQIPYIQAHEYHMPQKLLEDTFPVLFHDSRGIVEEDFLSHFDSISSFLNENNVSVFSFDFGPAAETVDVEDYYFIPKTKILEVNQIKDIVASKIAYMKQRYQGTLAFENLNYFPFSAYQHVCEPNVIRDIVLDNNVEMVLDIAHAVISAKNFDMSPLDYIMELPLESVVEIHLSKPGCLNGVWRDFHALPDEGIYELLRNISNRLRNDLYLVIEYYEDFDKLKMAHLRLSQFSKLCA